MDVKRTSVQLLRGGVAKPAPVAIDFERQGVVVDPELEGEAATCTTLVAHGMCSSQSLRDRRAARQIDRVRSFTSVLESADNRSRCSHL